MKYLPLRDLDTVSNALNFSTPDCHLIGGCDVFTTKAAGGDKKLYKNIEINLEEQYESLVRLSASLSPPYRAASQDSKGSEKDAGLNQRGRSVGIPDIDIARASPFGPLSRIGARRTFAYLIATLNASHPDYDFSHALKPSDFRKVISLRGIMQKIDSSLNNLRPRQRGLYTSEYLAPPPSAPRPAPVVNSAGNEIWSPRMWTLIDKEMGLKHCEMYSFDPSSDPFVGEEMALWSMHYFFFNKEKKRVCYLYLRCLSVISHSPVYKPSYLRSRPKLSKRKASSVSVGDGAGKRASYWLGNNALDASIDTGSYGDDDDDEMIIEESGEDEFEVPHMDLDDIRGELADGYHGYDSDDDFEVDEAWAEEGWKPRGSRQKLGGSLMM